MRGFLALLGGLLLGLAFSQFPEYAQQYQQRLAGAVDELKAITENFDTEAGAAGLSREAALARYETTGDSFIAGRGVSMAATFTRYEKLKSDLAEIRVADPIARLRLLPKFLDSDVGARAMEDFKPAVPVTPEGVLWGGAGVLLGYLGLSALLRFLMLPFSRLRRRRNEDRRPARLAATPYERREPMMSAGRHEPIVPDR